jgi:hypothetical protein
VIPKYPFIVTVTTHVGSTKLHREGKSFETIAAALAFSEAIKRKPGTCRVTVECRMMDWSKGTNGLGKEHVEEARAAL